MTLGPDIHTATLTHDTAVLPGVLWHAAWPLIALPGLRCWAEVSLRRVRQEPGSTGSRTWAGWLASWWTANWHGSALVAEPNGSPVPKLRA